MEDVTLAHVKAHLSKLLDRASRGEQVRITRRGRPVASLTAVERKVKPVNLTALHVLTASMPLQPEPAETWLRSVRGQSRY